MTRADRFRRHCRVLAALLLLVGLLRLTLSFTPLFDPLLAWPQTGCDPCSSQRDPVTLLEPEEARKVAWQTPGSEQRILVHLERPGVRVSLFAAELARALPFALLLLSLAAALRSLAAGGFTPDAVRWLRRAALASILWVLAQPMAQSIRLTTFSPITRGDEVTHIVVNANELFWPMLLSFAAWTFARALEQAAFLQQELEEYV